MIRLAFALLLFVSLPSVSVDTLDARNVVAIPLGGPPVKASKDSRLLAMCRVSTARICNW
jgi:hypothetical protein